MTSERLNDEFGDTLRFLVGDEVAGAGNRDHARVGARLERAPFVIGQPAVALLGVHHPGGHARVAQSYRK
jgi:hypothetical protein